MNKEAQGHSSLDQGHMGGGYEHSVLKLGWIITFFAGFIVLIVISFIIVRGVFSLFTRHVAEEKPAFERIAQPRVLPMGPRLQVNPKKELRALRDAEKKILENYAWVDREAGVVQIPIERAMRLLVQRGLPVRPSSPQPPGEKP